MNTETGTLNTCKARSQSMRSGPASTTKQDGDTWQTSPPTEKYSISVYGSSRACACWYCLQLSGDTRSAADRDAGPQLNGNRPTVPQPYRLCPPRRAMSQQELTTGALNIRTGAGVQPFRYSCTSGGRCTDHERRQDQGTGYRSKPVTVSPDG